MSKQEDQAIVDEIYGECVGARIRTVARAVSAIFDDAMRPFEVRFTQMNILVTAARIGDTRPADVCEILQLDHSTVSRSVVRLTERGWLEILPDPDGRTSPFRVTAEGHALVRKVYPAWRRAQKEASELLGSSFVAELHAAVGELHRAK